MKPSELQQLTESIKTEFDLFKYLDAIDMGAYVVNKERQIIHWSRASEEITGYSKADVEYKKCSDNILMHIDRNGVEICKTDLCPLHRTLKTLRSSEVPYALFIKTKAGYRLPVDITSFPLIINNELIGAVEFFKETELRHKDFEKAMHIQKAMMPKNLPENIEMFYHPAEMIGGDLIFYQEPWAAIIDVSGHGIASALISVAVKIFLQEILKPEIEFEELGKMLEQQIKTLDLDEIFITAAFVKFTGENKMKVKTFGHPFPLIIRQDKAERVTMLQDFVVGFDFAHHGVYSEIELSGNDRLFLYSDGLADIETRNGIINDQLEEIVANNSSLKDIYIKALNQNSRQYQNDDISMLMIKAIDLRADPLTQIQFSI